MPEPSAADSPARRVAAAASLPARLPAGADSARLRPRATPPPRSSLRHRRDPVRLCLRQWPGHACRLRLHHTPRRVRPLPSRPRRVRPSIRCTGSGRQLPPRCRAPLPPAPRASAIFAAAPGRLHPHHGRLPRVPRTAAPAGRGPGPTPPTAGSASASAESRVPAPSSPTSCRLPAPSRCARFPPRGRLHPRLAAGLLAPPPPASSCSGRLVAHRLPPPHSRLRRPTSRTPAAPAPARLSPAPLHSACRANSPAAPLAGRRAAPASSYSARAPASGHARAPPPARAPVASTAGCCPAHPPPARRRLRASAPDGPCPSPPRPTPLRAGSPRPPPSPRDCQPAPTPRVCAPAPHRLLAAPCAIVATPSVSASASGRDTPAGFAYTTPRAESGHSRVAHAGSGPPSAAPAPGASCLPAAGLPCHRLPAPPPSSRRPLAGSTLTTAASPVCLAPPHQPAAAPGRLRRPPAPPLPPPSRACRLRLLQPAAGSPRRVAAPGSRPAAGFTRA
nr:basic proline-rich protein-like [Aegilops tauschii subsp. strangulata]